MKCEYCESEHDGSFASGRFCNRKCSNGFSTKNKRKEINEKVQKKLKGKISKEGMRDANPPVTKTCSFCKKEFMAPYSKRNVRNCCSKSCATKLIGGWNATVHSKEIDWSVVHKAAYARGTNYVAGGTTRWIPYKDIKVQGSYELKACEKLDEMVKNGEIKSWQYSIDRIKYVSSEGKERTYIIDFTVITNEDQKMFIEVKGRETELDGAKWNSAWNQGLNLKVWRREDLFE